MQKKQRAILGVDLGSKNIGLALYRPGSGSQQLQGFTYQDVFELESRLSQHVTDYQVELLVVGDMGLDELPEKLEKALRKVTKKNNIEYQVVSERLSSFQADQDLGESGRKDKGLAAHSESALNILQDYLATSNTGS